MNCTRCQFKYDEIKHIPKLLIMCGHTLCEKCCSELLKNGKIQCLQCRTFTLTDKVSNLPKNLALISDRNINFKHCQKHSKKYEAFCSNEKLLICIQCILEDGHKNHQINSIDKAFQVQSSTFQTKMQKIHAYLNAIEQKAEENYENQSQLIKMFKQSSETVKQVFDSIRQLINEEQISILKQMQCLFQDHNQKLTQKKELYNEKIGQIKQILYKAQQFQSSTQIDFLDQVKLQQENLNLIKFISNENPKNISFNHTKQTILQTCIKILSSEKNPIKITNFNSNSNPSHIVSIPPKNTKGAFMQPLKGFRKAAFSNVSVCQNNRSQKKVSARKQSITHQVQTSTIKNIDKEKVLKPLNNLRQVSTCDNSNQKKSIKKIDIIECVNSDISAVDPRQSLCNSFMSNMTSFMSQNRSIYIVGGFNQQNSNILKLDLGLMTYQQIAQMNANRSKFGTIFSDRKLYVFGGKRGKQRLNDIEAFDFDKNCWVKIGIMSKSRSGFGITIIEDQIYLIGGNDGQNILNTAESFNIKTKEWKKLPSMNEQRDQLAIAVGNDGKIYAIGGFGGANNQPLRTVQYLDIKTKQWKQISKMKYARRALSAAVLADGIYAIGGFDGGSYMSSVQKFDFGSNQWLQACPMNIARCTHSSIAIYQTQQIYVFGGFDFLPLNTVQKYSLITNEWENMTNMPNARFMHSSTLVKFNI